MALVTKILLATGMKLLTERFLIAALIKIAEHLASKTTNTLDDELVIELKKALEQ